VSSCPFVGGFDFALEILGFRGSSKGRLRTTKKKWGGEPMYYYYKVQLLEVRVNHIKESNRFSLNQKLVNEIKKIEK
jgi:hypothetical protein